MGSVVTCAESLASVWSELASSERSALEQRLRPARARSRRRRDRLQSADCVEKLALNLACTGDPTGFLIELAMQGRVAALQAYLTPSSLPYPLQMASTTSPFA